MSAGLDVQERASALDELAHYLVAPGEGVFAVSTGKAAREAATRRYLGDDYQPDRGWRTHLAEVLDPDRSTKVAVFAIPSDCGAGIVRGAAHGPQAIRAALGSAPVPDLGDVFTIPHLLSDEMLNDGQIERCRQAIYPRVSAELRATMPVSPLSIARRVMELLRKIAPELRLFVLGGDHSVTWPVIDELLDAEAKRNRGLSKFGILHFDAHTDLSVARLGVDICFATWAHHARERLGPRPEDGQRLLQIGIRASARDRGHWQTHAHVRQIWAAEAIEMGPERLAEATIAHFGDLGVTRLYLSNDIDGTDQHYAAACGTPEPGGLTPEHVLAVLEAVGNSDIEVVGGDLVEVAPGLSLDEAASQRTLDTALRYTRASLALL